MKQRPALFDSHPPGGIQKRATGTQASSGGDATESALEDLAERAHQDPAVVAHLCLKRGLQGGLQDAVDVLEHRLVVFGAVDVADVGQGTCLEQGADDAAGQTFAERVAEFAVDMSAASGQRGDAGEIFFFNRDSYPCDWN